MRAAVRLQPDIVPRPPEPGRATAVLASERCDMALEEELFAIEEGFWLSGHAHFLEHVDAECVLAFPQMGEMHGIFSRADVAASATTANRWRDLRISDRHLLRPDGDVAFISYHADVTRADGEPYSALIGSAYVRRSDGWKLAFHQHSPVEG
jgi:ketosteroid isomerase-like protein